MAVALPLPNGATLRGLSVKQRAASENSANYPINHRFNHSQQYL